MIAPGLLDALPANSSGLSESFERCKETLLPLLGSQFRHLDEDDLKLIWAVILAHNSRPYGNSMAFSLREISSEKMLDCDNYAMLAWHFFNLLAPHAKLQVRMVGWEGGAVGNHAQLMSEGGSLPLLLDSTIGLVAITTFDDLLRGRPSPAAVLSTRDEPAGFRDRVVRAVSEGLYKPSDLLYWFSDPGRYPRELSSQFRWPTPAAQKRTQPQ